MTALSDQVARAVTDLGEHVASRGRTAENIEALGQIPGPGVTFFAMSFTCDGRGPLLGIAGGYIGDTTESTGHTYTNFAPVTDTFGQDATTLIAERDRELMGSVTAGGRTEADETVTIVLTRGQVTVPEIEGMEITARHVKIPRLSPIAERAYLWPGANQAVSSHTGHIVLRSRGGKALPRAMAHAVATAEIAGDPRAVAVLANETLYEPAMYREVVTGTPEGLPPVLALVQLGLAKEKGVLHGFTVGLAAFGKDEFLLTGGTAETLQHTLLELASHVLLTGAVLSGPVTLSTGTQLTLTREGEGDTAVLTGSLNEGA